MLEPWNDKSILPPPVNTAKFYEDLDIKLLMHICNTIIHVLSRQSPLHKESAIFSRFLYKFDKKFRNDIGYRYFKKVYTALRKYLNLTLIKDVQNFINILPAEDEASKYAPTRQMLEYVLIRLMTFSKLMSRITQCSKQAAVFYLDRVKRGESHWMCLMPYALLSRVWSMGFVLLQHSCNWYNQLLPILKLLEFKGTNFLPDNYELPSDLEKWIDLKQLHNAGRFEWSQKLSINIDSIIEEDEEGDLCETILKYVNKINKSNELTTDDPDTQLIIPKYEISIKAAPLKINDQGERISRESFKNLMNNLPPILPPKPTGGKKKEHLCLINVSNGESLREFIGNEEKYRNKSKKKSLTSHLTFMQWQALKNALERLDDPLINKRKFIMKINKVWKEKCLDYK